MTFKEWDREDVNEVAHHGISVLIDWKAEREKLIGALEKHGRHINGCLGHIGSPCSCGLRAVLAEVKEQG